MLPFYSTPLYAARPLTTDDAWTVERGKFQVEMGLDFLREDNHDRGFTPSLTFTYGVLVALVGEIAGINNFSGRQRDDPFSGLIGTTYLLSEHFVWDAGVEFGMNRAAPDFRLTTGLTLLFKP